MKTIIKTIAKACLVRLSLGAEGALFSTEKPKREKFILKEHNVSISPDFAFRFVEAFRGTWLGINRGLYKRGTHLAMDPACLDDTAVESFVDAIHIFRNDNEVAGDAFTAIGKLTYVLANLNTCNFRQPVVDLITWCDEAATADKNNDTANKLRAEKSVVKRKLEAYGEVPTDGDISPTEMKGCSIFNVADNYSKNLFHVMSKISNLVEVLKDFPAQNSDELKTQCLDVGEDLGTFVRIALGFHQD